MNEDFLAWYNAKYPESTWDKANILKDNYWTDYYWTDYLDRDEHQRMLYDAWCAGQSSFS